MSRQFIIVLFAAIAIGVLGGIGLLAAQQLKSDGGAAASLMKLLAAQVMPQRGGAEDDTRAYITAVDELMLAMKGLGEWSNRDMFNLAMEDWLIRKDEDEKKKILRAILEALDGEEEEEPAACSNDKEKCTALLLRAMRAEVDKARERLQALPVPNGALALNQMILSYSSEVLSIFDDIMGAEQERDKAKAVAAIYALRKLERNNYDLIEEELNRVIQGPSPISKMYDLLNPLSP